MRVKHRLRRDVDGKTPVAKKRQRKEWHWGFPVLRLCQGGGSTLQLSTKFALSAGRLIPTWQTFLGQPERLLTGFDAKVLRSRLKKGTTWFKTSSKPLEFSGICRSKTIRSVGPLPLSR